MGLSPIEYSNLLDIDDFELSKNAIGMWPYGEKTARGYRVEVCTLLSVQGQNLNPCANGSK